MSELEASLLVRLRRDLIKENRLYNALQTKVEQLLEVKQGITEEDLSKEIYCRTITSEAHDELVIRADTLKQNLGHYLDVQLIQQEFDTLMDHSDPSAGEFEKDCSRVQKKISNFLHQAGSFYAPSVNNSRRTFEKYLVNITVKHSQKAGQRDENARRRQTVTLQSQRNQDPRGAASPSSENIPLYLFKPCKSLSVWIPNKWQQH